MADYDHLRELSKRLFLISQNCLDLGAARQARLIAEELERMALSMQQGRDSAPGSPSDDHRRW